MTALKKIFASLLLLAATLATSPCRADPANLAQAEKLFQSGDWEKARQAYKTELAAASDPTALSPAFYYDYGTALARAGAAGEAYVSLLRSAYSMPFDSDVKHNLRMVENQVPAAVRSVQPATWIAWWPGGLRTVPWKLWLILALSFSATALALRRLRDPTFFYGAGFAALLLFLWAGLAWNQSRLPVFGAITLAKVKSGPGATFSDITTLEPGSLVSEELARDGWLKVRFLKPDAVDETVGWVEPASVLRVF